MDVRVVAAHGTIQPGDWKELRLKLGPVPITWKLVHEGGSGDVFFADVQVSGPFRSWRHEHIIAAQDAATTVLEDRLSYQLPLPPIGPLLAGRFVRRQLDRTFHFRHQRTQHDLARHCEAGLHYPLRIAISGASGLVGRHLTAFLQAGGHVVQPLVRRQPENETEIFWDPGTGEIDAAKLEGIDAVVHLAGASIASGRWSAKRKEAIRESRIRGTRLIAETLTRLSRPPRVLISGSAIGFYGDAGDNLLTEDAPPGEGFLAEVCQAWEAAALPAKGAGIRVVHLRTGIVIAGAGGLLPRVALPFRLGVGGQLGNGRQWMSWIALDDLLGIILEAVANDRLAGPLNAVAPAPVTNRDFTHVLGRVLRRPTIARVPGVALRLVAGQLADELILASQRAIPARLDAAGFRFAFPNLEEALRFELGRPTPDS